MAMGAREDVGKGKKYVEDVCKVVVGKVDR